MLFKKYWDVIGGDILSFVKEFKTTSSIPRGCNSSFFTLVPKVEDPIVIGDFRPISLIGCQYKIIAKVLANWLANVISSVVGEERKLFMLKIDFEKAFDTLNWSFLDSTMSQMGFSHKWRKWVHSCLDSAFASVLINGSPTSEFKLHRGLRQGDPLSPLLFILAIEALNVAFIEAKNKNLFHGVEVGVDKVHVSHLQFANDALILRTCLESSLASILHPTSKLSSTRVSSLELAPLNLSSTLLLPLSGVFLLISHAPKTIINKLEGICRKFFWGGSSNTYKIPWNKVISSPKQGGLGIGSLVVSNQALLAKWWWRFLIEDNALWCKVIRSIHGSQGGLHDASLIRSKSGPWYRIAKLNEDLLNDYGINITLFFKKKRLVTGSQHIFGWIIGWVVLLLKKLSLTFFG
ncbi:RNA-directed DNA polymerase, eukaryota, reverse transcriptase zinc-binding domain protein [Tanacetum coccineum]